MQFTLTLPHDADSIRLARHALDRLAGEVDAATLRTAQLLVSEVVTNAVRHSSGTICLRVSGKAGHVRVEVVDEGGGFEPLARHDGQDPGSGWGLHLLARIASRWGVGANGPRARSNAAWSTTNGSSNS